MEDDEIPIARLREEGMEISCEKCAWVRKFSDHVGNGELAKMLTDGQISPEVGLPPVFYS